MTINTVNLVGYAGQHPNVRYFENGKVLCKFPVMVESGNANGETLFESIDLEIWNKTAEIAARYVPKGRLIGITGSLKFSSWLERKTGKIRSQPVILVDQIYLLGAKVDNQPLPTSAQKGNQNSQYSAKSGSQNSYQEYYDDYEDQEDSDQSYYSEYEEYDTSIQSYYSEYKYEEYDTSMDYGYLDDMNSMYEHFHSLGDFE